jgi:tetratricopeptide (TPR) repeat protein
VEFVVASVAAGLQSLPETLERTRHELALQMALGPALLARHGATALVVEQAYVRMWELCQQVGETSQCCAALLGLGSCHIVRGRLHTARELLQQAVRCAPGAPTAADHGQAHVLGLQILAEARAVLAASEERYQEAELYRLQGALVWQCATCQPASTVVARPSPRHQPPLDTAAACFRQALAIARQQGARALELRAALSLSRLWQQQGKRTEAYELLAPIYDWFTEGFDTADLQEAQVLLEALKG